MNLKSINDLEVKQENNDVRLVWKWPEKYKDGTYFKNDELKGYTIRLIEKKNPFNIQDISADKEEKLFSLMKKDDYNFYIGAVNNDDVVSDYVAYP